jgi:hypothetical protein
MRQKSGSFAGLARDLLIEKYPSSTNANLGKGLQGWRPGSPFSFLASGLSGEAACRAGCGLGRAFAPWPGCLRASPLAVCALMVPSLGACRPGRTPFKFLDPAGTTKADGASSGRRAVRLAPWPNIPAPRAAMAPLLILVGGPAAPAARRRQHLSWPPEQRCLPSAQRAVWPARKRFSSPTPDHLRRNALSPSPNRGVRGPEAPGRRRPLPLYSLYSLYSLCSPR